MKNTPPDDTIINSEGQCILFLLLEAVLNYFFLLMFQHKNTYKSLKYQFNCKYLYKHEMNVTISVNLNLNKFFFSS